jgi:hypothetical protein
MAKYLYSMRVKKIVHYEEITVRVKAENEAVAKKLAKEEAQYRNIIDVDKVKYKVDVVSYSCKPVEE